MGKRAAVVILLAILLLAGGGILWSGSGLRSEGPELPAEPRMDEDVALDDLDSALAETNLTASVEGSASEPDTTQEGCVIRCRVFRHGGEEPVKGADVRVDWRAPDGRRLSRQARTDADGRCNLPGLPAEVALRVQARAARGVSESARVRFAREEIERSVRLDLLDGGEITGLLLRHDGGPVEDPRVVVFRPEPAAGEAQVEIEGGRFRVIGLATCAFDLSFSGAGCGTVVKRSVPPGTRDLAVILPRPGSIRGVVTERSSGKPLPGLSVVRGGSGLRELSRTTADDRGAFTFEDLGPGSHVLWLGTEGADGYRADYVVVDLPEGESKTAEIVADEGLGVSVSVRLVGPGTEKHEESFGLTLSQKPVDEEGVVRSYRRWKVAAVSGEVVRSPAIFAPGRVEVGYRGPGRSKGTWLGRIIASGDSLEVAEFTVRIHPVLRGVIVGPDDRVVRADGYVAAGPMAGGAGGLARHGKFVDGEFLLGDVHPGLYRVFASLSDGRMTSTLEVEVGSETKVLRLPLEELEGVLTGRLIDDAGHPVVRAWVTISSASGRFRAVRSDADGWWRAEGVEEGPLTIYISPQVAGYESVEIHPEKTPGHCRLDPVVLSRRRWISGRVVDAADRPRLARIHGDDRFLCASWVDGEFHVAIPSDTRRLSAVVLGPNGDRTLFSGTTRLLPSDREVRIVVHPTPEGEEQAPAVADARATVRGRVTEQGTGLPVADVDVVLVRERNVEAMGRLDAGGRFVIRSREGSGYQIRVYSSAWARTLSEPFDLRAGEEKQVDLVVGRGQVLRGRLLDSDGQPIEGALVHTGAGLEKTDRQGRFVIPGASPNDRIAIRCRDYQAADFVLEPSDFGRERDVRMLRIGER